MQKGIVAVGVKRSILWARRMPLLVKAGAGCGLFAGVVAGAMNGPPGIVLGLGLGMVVGVIAGIVMDRDDKRRSVRTRELDDIIGTTSGSLGVPRGSIPPPSTDDEERSKRGPTNGSPHHPLEPHSPAKPSVP
jgi:hypothetical protein